MARAEGLRSTRRSRISILQVPLAALLLLGGTLAARAETVSFELEVPAGIDRIEVTAVRLLAAGAPVGSLSFSLSSQGGSNQVAIGITVTELPDAVEVEYLADDGGALGAPTLYVVSGAELVADTPYFLPAPSPGGTIGPQPGTLGSDAFFQLAAVAQPNPTTDFVNPTCQVVRDGGTLTATLQDGQSGLAEIEVLLARNAEVTVPAFTPGTTDPVEVLAQTLDPLRTLTLVLRATDQEGNFVLCHRVERRQRGRTWIELN
jgi:hypothetical protein